MATLHALNLPFHRATVNHPLLFTRQDRFIEFCFQIGATTIIKLIAPGRVAGGGFEGEEGLIEEV